MNSGKVGFNYCMNLIFSRFQQDFNKNNKEEEEHERRQFSREYPEENQGLGA